MFDRPVLKMPDVIETPCFILRTPQPGDGAVMNAAYQASRERLAPWFPWAQKEYTDDEYEQLMREKHADYIRQDDFMLFIIEKDSGTLIGTSGLHFRSHDPLIFEIGYWLRTGFEGHGTMAAVVREIVRVGFGKLNAEKIIIRADEENLRSQAVAIRCGFHLDGTMRWYERGHDDPDRMVNMMYFSLLPEEFEELEFGWRQEEVGA